VIWPRGRPRLRRALTVAGVTQTLAIGAVCLAPRASASTNAVVLGWTGLKDGYGVPIGDYYLALASLREQITAAGPGLSWDPGSWARWTVHALDVLASSITAASILTGEAGLFVGLIALALWIMKVTVSTYWLTVIGEIAHAISGAVIDVTTRLGLLMIAIPIGVFAGVITVRRGEVGRGATMILIAMTMPALSVAVFGDPAGEMYGPDGLLAFGRRVGFSVAAAATHDGAVTGGDDQVGALTASLITHVVREPLQLWNFGHVIDRVGGCGAAWSAAVRAGAPDGPIAAMKACGDRAAVAYAQQLDGTNVWVGAALVVAAGLLAVFMTVSGWAVLKVSVKAIWTTVILLPALWLGAIPGAPQRRATEVVWQFFAHGIEVCVYIVYVSVIGLAVQRMVSSPLPAQLGGTNPFAHVLMMGGVSIAAFLLLRHVRSEFGGRARQRGMLGRVADVAIGMGVSHAVGGAGAAAMRGARGLRGRAAGAGEPPPWERAGGGVGDAAAVHGAPQPGFDPVPGGGALFAGDVGERGSSVMAGEPGDGEGRASRPRAARVVEMTVGVDDVEREKLSPQARHGSGDWPSSVGDWPDGGGGSGGVDDGQGSAGVGDATTPEVPPIVDGGPIPLPPEPPDDEPPPDEDFSGNV
jgi:hypothetical protein